MESTVYKIKDSVDLFLSDNSFLTAYFMNSRRRKSFRINDEMVYLLEQIDGERNTDQICEIMPKDSVAGKYRC